MQLKSELFKIGHFFARYKPAPLCCGLGFPRHALSPRHRYSSTAGIAGYQSTVGHTDVGECPTQPVSAKHDGSGKGEGGRPRPPKGHSHLGLPHTAGHPPGSPGLPPALHPRVPGVSQSLLKHVALASLPATSLFISHLSCSDRTQEKQHLSFTGNKMLVHVTCFDTSREKRVGWNPNPLSSQIRNDFSSDVHASR